MDGSGELAMIGTPAAEVVIDTALVAGLLKEQHSDLASWPLTITDAGWDNALIRLGDHLAIRLPRRAAAAPLINQEQAWLPQLAPHLPLPIPVPLRIGRPGRGYPWNWSVVPWINGSAADQSPPDTGQAQSFADFLCSLHVPAPADAPANPLRGVPLRHRAAAVEQRLQRLSHSTDLITPAIRQIWKAALDAPVDQAATWIHGDLHPRNILVEAGRIAGVIDWGDLTAGDRATDWASLWMLFPDPQSRRDAWAASNLAATTLQRAQGWAVLFSVMFLDTGLVDNPRNAAIGERTLRRLAEDADRG
jgi:aminoglycoside phosphotransferase (APT) family kinase protein